MEGMTSTHDDRAPAGTRAEPAHRTRPHASTAPSELPQQTGWTARRASATAGIALLLMIVPALLGNFVAVEGLVTAGDGARTAADIAASEGLFRAGIAALFIVVMLDVVVAWALYQVFRPVGAGLSALAAAFRFLYAGIFMVAITRLAGVANLLGSDELADVLGPQQVQAQTLLGISAYREIWSAGLLLFGVHLLVLGYLAYRSGFVPRVLGALLALAGFGYTFDSVAATLVGDGAPAIAEFTFLGEVLLAIWLILWSRRQPGG